MTIHFTIPSWLLLTAVFLVVVFIASLVLAFAVRTMRDVLLSHRAFKFALFYTMSKRGKRVREWEQRNYQTIASNLMAEDEDKFFVLTKTFLDMANDRLDWRGKPPIQSGSETASKTQVSENTQP